MSNAQFEIVVLCPMFFMALPYPSYSFKFAIIMSTTLSIRSRKRFPAPKIGALKAIGEAEGSELVWIFRNVLEDCITVHPSKLLFLSPLEAGSLFSFPQSMEPEDGHGYAGLIFPRLSRQQPQLRGSGMWSLLYLYLWTLQKRALTYTT